LAGECDLVGAANRLALRLGRLAAPPSHFEIIFSGVTDFARRAAELARNPGKRQRFGAAARAYALTRRWESALAPLYRAYLAAPRTAAAPSIGVGSAAALGMPAAFL